MTQHTPGPWYATTLTHDGETYSHVQSASINEDNYVARVDVVDEQGEANAVLISVAPLMLEALQNVDDAYSGNGDMAAAVDTVLLAIEAAKYTLDMHKHIGYT